MIDLPDDPSLQTNEPITTIKLSELESTLGNRLPSGYRDLLLLSDGISFASSMLIYGSDDLVERNETWEVGTYAPGFLAFGDTGGGSVLLVSSDEANSRIYLVGSGSMEIEDATVVADNMEAWIKGGFRT